MDEMTVTDQMFERPSFIANNTQTELAIDRSITASKFPFAFAKKEKDPLMTRVRSKIRAKHDFERVDKFHIEKPPKHVTGDVPLEERAALARNPYRGNRRTRKNTKGSFGNEGNVLDLYANNDGRMQQKQNAIFERLVPSIQV